MDELPGTLGTSASLALRLGQAIFSIASLLFMCLDVEFYSYTPFCFLVTIMGLVIPWSLTLAMVDAFSVLVKRPPRQPGMMSIIVIGDWVLSFLSLAASCSTASVADLMLASGGSFCSPKLCSRYQLSAAMAFLSCTAIVKQRTKYNQFSWVPLTCFYGNSGECTKHKHHYKTHFCCDCISEPYCEKCCQKHQNHQVLQVVIASHRAAIRVDDIVKSFDVAGIQPYWINFKAIVYLKSREKSAQCPEEKEKSTQRKHSKCKICQGQLIKEEYKFCSITCKVKEIFMKHGKRDLFILEEDDPSTCEFSVKPLSILARQIEDNVDFLLKVCTGMIETRSLMENVNDEGHYSAAVSLRKRKRKGKPHRAPFY